MPYIPQRDRSALYGSETPQTPGELNFVITDVVDDYLGRSLGINYAKINEVIGVLECAKLELYRQIAAPYEDEKKAENGDVYLNSRP